jgi:hypothetical protein
MKLKEIYDKNINRSVNPAVSASDFSDETVKTEIDEYVFTDEIINGICKIISAVKNRNTSHDGIWINGYFGSGKSHFLKYLDYCLSSKYGKHALTRLQEAVESRDPWKCKDSKSEVDISDMNDIAAWLRSATVDTIPFNIGTVHNNNSDQNTVFLDIFWNELNNFRGFNKFNLALAQHFEKVLQEKGKFEEFKARIKDEGFDWETQANDLAINELDSVLDIGKEFIPTLSTDVIRERIAKNDINLSVETFTNELKSYLTNKDDKYRLIFLVDEVSQFIDDRKELLLQLQEIVTRLHETCNDKIWIACTAQQDLDEIVENCKISHTSEDYGKIMGRFEVKVSLKGTHPEYITQKRILEKNGKAEVELGNLYDNKKNAISAQFQLPTSYNAYQSRNEFIDYYPFVPYQFKLIMQVFNSFVNRGYVEKEVKGNERSIIKVTHTTAKQTQNQEVGSFISFDQFYNAMFQGSLIARGQRAIQKANDMIHEFNNSDFGQRIVNILFMICNMSDTDRLIFPATVDNITCLLMNDVDTQKLLLKSDVQKVLDFLCDKNIIRTESAKKGVPETYCFYSEDEIEVAELIKHEEIDYNTMAEELKDIFFNYTTPIVREIYFSSRFSIGVNIMGKNFLTNNADINIEFVIDSDQSNVNAYAFNNPVNRLVFFMTESYKENKALRNDFYWYCQVQKYMRTPPTSELRQKTREEFVKRAGELFRSKIERPFHEIFDSCPILSGQNLIDDLGVSKGAERYKAALNRHFATLYTYARLATSADMPKTSDDLKSKILRNIEIGDYGDMNTLSDAEKQVESYLNRQFDEVNLKDIVNHYSAAPYGWNEICTIYIVNELVRRHLRDFSYNNNPNIDRTVVAGNVMDNLAKFTVRPAKVISQELINRFVESWKDIFGTVSISAGVDSSELFRRCKEKLDSNIKNTQIDIKKVTQYPFVSVLNDVVDLLDGWSAERDSKKFFELVISDRQSAKETIDKRKLIGEFINDQLTRYIAIRKFVDENRDNWLYLPESCADNIKYIKTIVNEPWPIDRIVPYNKIMRELSAQLENVNKTKAEKIESVYNNVFDRLEQFAESKKVARQCFAKRDITIMQKKNTSNILALENNINTANDFYNSQIDLIIKHIPVIYHEPEAEGSGTLVNDSGGNEPIQPKSTKNIKLNILTSTPLKSEDEVDEYLKDLKKQLMTFINDNCEVMVTK